MTESSDFPAAHSMDTTWFAVDPDGNVAVFESGEAGAVPVDAYVGDDGYGLLAALRASGHSSGVIWEVGSLIGNHAAPSFNDGQTTFILVVRAARGLGDEIERIGGQSIDASGAPEGAKAFLVEGLPNALHAKLHESAACLGCVWHFGDDEQKDPASFGLYHYEHTCENWISGPYQLATHPAAPLRADALPAEVAKHCIRVPRPFRETKSLNPPEHWPCESWEPGWLDSDGKTVHVFPGREKDFEMAAQNLGPEFVIDRGTSRAKGNGHGNGGTPAKPWWKFW